MVSHLVPLLVLVEVVSKIDITKSSNFRHWPCGSVYTEEKFWLNLNVFFFFL